MISHGNFNGFTPCFFYSVSALSNTITLWISSTILQTLSNLIHNHLSSQMYISDINYGFELMPNHWLTHKQPISDQKGKQLQPVALRPPPPHLTAVSPRPYDAREFRKSHRLPWFDKSKLYNLSPPRPSHTNMMCHFKRFVIAVTRSPKNHLPWTLIRVISPIGSRCFCGLAIFSGS